MIALYLSSVCDLLESPRRPDWPPGINSDRRARIERFVRREDRNRALASEFLSRKAISFWTGIPPEDLVIERDEFGKPILVTGAIHFNVSHSGQFVVCAVGTAPLGVDLEAVRPIRQLQEITARYFSPRERNWIEAGSGTDRSSRFFEIWTLKEAYLKAIGKGLTVPLSSFSVLPPSDGTPTGRPYRQEGWFLKSYAPMKGYRLALCATTPCLPTGLSELPLSREKSS